MTVDDMIADLIAREGGYVDHPADRGGPTKYGITQATLDNFWHRPASVAEVQALTEFDAASIYKEIYYYNPGIDLLPKPWRVVVFDWGVNSGTTTAIRELQKLCRAHGCDPGPLDGIIGPKTVAAAGRLLKTPLHWYLERRRWYYRQIVANDRSQEVFLAGWMNRVAGLEAAIMKSGEVETA